MSGRKGGKGDKKKPAKEEKQEDVPSKGDGEKETKKKEPKGGKKK